MKLILFHLSILAVRTHHYQNVTKHVTMHMQTLNSDSDASIRNLFTDSEHKNPKEMYIWYSV